jgi:alpha-amylase
MLKLIIFSLLICSCFNEDCFNFNGEYGCQGQQTEYPDNWSERAWQTPPKSDSSWRSTYQDMHLLVGYVQTIYNRDRTSATLNFITRVNKKELPENYQIYYYFNAIKSAENSFKITKSNIGENSISVRAEIVSQNNPDQILAKLELDPVDLIWNNYQIPKDSHSENGQKGAIVEMFGWPYTDIEKECEFLSKAGYLGVKVFPPNESILSYTTVENGELNPWYFVYQPVSYKMNSRQGTREQLKSMISTCRRQNVRVYADAVINHMTGSGNDMYSDHRNPSGGSCIHWPNKNSSAGSPWYTHGFEFQNNKYTGQRPSLEYPAVPYDATDFHCERSLNSWTDPFALNYGWLVGLSDLKTEKEYVRQRIADYLTDLLSMGFSGFRIDAAKHINPDNLSAIFKKFKDNLGGGDLPEDFITYLEVIIGGEKDLLMCSENSYSYGQYFEKAMKKAGLSDSDVDKVKIWESDYPKEHPICGYWAIKSERYAIGLDCHDDQNPGSSSRDMGDKGSVLIKEKNVDKHRRFEVLLLFKIF